MRISVVGSFRENDSNYFFQRSFEEFKKICFYLGQKLAESDKVSSFVMTISNDYLAAQMETVKDGVPKFRIEDTADYLAMVGFLVSAREKNKKVKLFISPKMIEGGESEIQEIKITPFWERTFVEPFTGKVYKLGDYFDLFDRVDNVSEIHYRSHILEEYIPENADVVIFVGGGKATNLVYAKLTRHHVLPLPYFGGVALKYFQDKVMYGEIMGRNYARIFPKDALPEHDEAIKSMSVLRFMDKANRETARSKAIDNASFEEIYDATGTVLDNLFSDDVRYSEYMLSSDELRDIRESLERERGHIKGYFRQLNIRMKDVGKFPHWWDALFSEAEGKTNNLDYNGFELFFKDILPTHGFEGFTTITEQQIRTKNTDKEVVFYDFRNREWQFSDNFLSDLFHHLGCKADNYERLVNAITMLLFHEALHAHVHGIIPGNQVGIGDFYHVIEDADYQADVWAIMVQFNYMVHRSNLGVKGNDFQECFKELIDIALTTTKAFMDVSRPARSIEIRRFNRTLFLAWQRARISRLNTIPEEQLKRILKALIEKPSLEFRGRLQVSSYNNSRIEFSLNEDDLQRAYDDRELGLAIFSRNKFVKSGDIPNAFNVLEFFRAFRDMDIAKINEPLELVYNNHFN